MAQAEAKDNAKEDEEITQIIKYWFRDMYDDFTVSPTPERVGWWYGGGAAIDKEITEKFGQLVKDVCIDKKDKYKKWADTAKGKLAIIILGDQFTRNIYRGSKDMFSCDSYCQSMVHGDLTINENKEGFDEKFSDFKDFDTINELYKLNPIYLQFYFSPLLHSEDIKFQKRNKRLNLWLIDKLKNDSIKCKDNNNNNNNDSANNEKLYADWSEYFTKAYEFVDSHLKDIEKFGRFAHRNDLLGRQWTDEEREFVEKSGRMKLINGSQDDDKNDKEKEKEKEQKEENK